MNVKDKKSSKRTGEAFSSELLLAAALKEMGLLFPDSDEEVEKIESDPKNEAELPESLKDPMRIIEMAESDEVQLQKISAPMSRTERKEHSPLPKAAGWYRSGEKASNKDEEEIEAVLAEVAKKIDKEDE
jgi:hypothetical protein